MHQDLIHPTAVVSSLAELARDVRIWQHTVVGDGARIGAETVIGSGCYVDSGVVVGARCKIQNGVKLYAGVTVEDGVFLGPAVTTTNDKYPRAILPDGSLKGPDDWVPQPTLIRYGASIGAGAVLIAGIELGTFCIVGAGSVVIRPVPPHAMVAGSPARLIGHACVCGARIETGAADVLECPLCSRQLQLLRDVSDAPLSPSSG